MLLELPLLALKDAWTRYIVAPASGLLDFDVALTQFQTFISALFEEYPSEGRAAFAFFPSALRNPIMQAGADQHTEPEVRPVIEPRITPSDVTVGREFIWEPGSVHARCKVRVDKVQHDPNGDVRVFTTTIDAMGSMNKQGVQCWNDMSRFIEACVPALNRGAEHD